MARHAIGVFNGNWKNKWRDEEYTKGDDANHLYWRNRLTRAMEIILAHPEMEAVWDSDLVPDHTTYKAHALLAEQIVRGELTQ